MAMNDYDDKDNDDNDSDLPGELANHSIPGSVVHFFSVHSVLDQSQFVLNAELAADRLSQVRAVTFESIVTKPLDLVVVPLHQIRLTLHVQHICSPTCKNVRKTTKT